MAACWLSARTCSLLPSSSCFSWCVSFRTQLRPAATPSSNQSCHGFLYAGSGGCWAFAFGASSFVETGGTGGQTGSFPYSETSNRYEPN
jgi:hypothetical protein